MRLDTLARRLRLALLLLGVPMAFAYWVVPQSAATELLLYDGVVLLALLASAAGWLQAEQPLRRAWACTVVALAAFLGGELVWWGYAAAGHDPFPSAGDALVLFAYVPLGLTAAMLVAARERRPDRTAWLDAWVVTAVAGLVVWRWLIEPLLSDSGDGFLSTAVTVAYPLADLLVLGIVLRLLLSRSGLDTGARLFALGVGATLAADLVFAWQDMRDGYVAGSWVDTTWLIGYLLLGLAPLQPSRSADLIEEYDDAGLGRLVFMLIAVAVPAFVLLHELSGLDALGATTATIAVAVATAVMALVSLRLWRLIAKVRRAEVERGTNRLSALVTHSADAILLVDRTGDVRYASPAVEAVLGRTAAELTGGAIADELVPASREPLTRQLGNLMLMPAGATLPLDAQVPTREGSVRVIEGTGCNLLDDGDVAALVLTLRDVTTRRELEEQLERRAFHDELTGLPNRALFGDRVEQALGRLRRDPGVGVAVLFVDLDDFKTVNDGMGHGAGDELLRGVAARLRTCLRPGDTVARLGGDEFAVLLEQVPSVEYAATVAERLLEVLQLPIDVGEISLAARASIGVTIAAEESTVESLVRDADIAMYGAKSQGKRRHLVFDAALRSRAVERLALRVELPDALRRGQLRLEYQPIRSVVDGRLRGFEALLRWDHPLRGTISPGDFIPAAEDSGAIVEIGRWVLERACEQAASWNERSEQPLSMSVNVSGAQLQHVAFIDDLRTALATSQLEPQRLVIELTESVLADHRTVQPVLEQVRGLGVGIAIDDFGTGYSSLSYLQQFPVTSIKVDRSFVNELNARGDAGLVRSILSIAAALGLATVAEGVETDGQLAALNSLDCDLAQGFYLGRPQTPQDVLRMIQEDDREPVSERSAGT